MGYRDCPEFDCLLTFEDLASLGTKLVMPKKFPLELLRDVVADDRQPAPVITQVARHVGISASCFQRLLTLDDVEEVGRPGVSQAESVELREAKKGIRAQD